MDAVQNALHALFEPVLNLICTAFIVAALAQNFLDSVHCQRAHAAPQNYQSDPRFSVRLTFNTSLGGDIAGRKCKQLFCIL